MSAEDMEDATRLIGDLHKKLATLDHSVAAYRQEMTSEFRRYSHNLLRDTPNDISSQVERTIAQSFSQFPNLDLHLDKPSSPPSSTIASVATNTTPTPTSTTTSSTTTTTTTKTADSLSSAGATTNETTDTSQREPGSNLIVDTVHSTSTTSLATSSHPQASPATVNSQPATAGTVIHPQGLPVKSIPGSSPPSDSRTDSAPASESLRLASPNHDSELELRGLFTPAYLPLLHSNQSSVSAASENSPATSSPSLAAPDATVTMGRSGDEKGKGKEAKSASSVNLSSDRPYHSRRATDDTNSSGASDQGDVSKVRRSALRRSSAGVKPPPSPRRVRFEFEGGEVLPTSSPQSSEPSLAQSHSMSLSGRSLYSNGSLFAVDEPSEKGSEEDSMSAEDILGPDQEPPPPPKKVSSSQALRALSRAPLDSNTVWTVVNAGSPEPSSDRDSPRNAISPASSKSSLQDSPMKMPPAPPVLDTASAGRLSPPRSKKILKSPPPERNVEIEDEEEDESSDDDFLAMAKPKSFANKKTPRSPLSRSPATNRPSPPDAPSVSENSSAPTNSAESPVASSSATTSATTTSSAAAASPAKKDKPHSSDPNEDEEGLFHFEGGPQPKTSKAEPIPEVEGEGDDEEEDLPISQGQGQLSTSPAVTIPKSDTPLPTHLNAGSVGSFRGRSVTMPVVTDPEVYAQAASLGNMNSFIGGLDGKTGADEGDLASYRASVGQAGLFSGTPRSLTERMMMEEAQAARRAAAQGSR